MRRTLDMTLAQIVESRKDEILEIARQNGATNVRLFGSVARGDDDGSDIDILCELQDGRSLLDLARLKRQLGAVLNREVDVVTERGLRSRIKETVLREARPI